MKFLKQTNSLTHKMVKMIDKRHQHQVMTIAKWQRALKKAEYVNIWLKNEITIRFMEI